MKGSWIWAIGIFVLSVTPLPLLCEEAPSPPEASSPDELEEIPDFGLSPRETDLAVVIGIEKYRDLPSSQFSSSDAKLVKKYLNALGFPERNIQLLLDERATLSDMVKSMEKWIQNRAKKESRVFLYYSGHGSPDPATGEPYLVPHDGDPNYLADTAYPLKKLYAKLGTLPVSEVTVVLDACFSGAGPRSVLASGARPLVTKMGPGVALPPNLGVLAAAQGSQISTSSPEKKHGILTYHFLKALQNGKSGLTEIYKQIKPLVEDDAKSLNVQQSPALLPQSQPPKKFFAFPIQLKPRQPPKPVIDKETALKLQEEQKRMEEEKKRMGEEKKLMAEEKKRVQEKALETEQKLREKESEHRQIEEEKRHLEREKRELRKKKVEEEPTFVPPTF